MLKEYGVVILIYIMGLGIFLYGFFMKKSNFYSNDRMNGAVDSLLKQLLPKPWDFYVYKIFIILLSLFGLWFGTMAKFVWKIPWD